MQPEVWAEDGTYFLPDALHLGWHSLFKPFFGYFDLIQRGILLLSVNVVPLRWVPLFYNFLYLVLYAWVLSLWVREEYAWIMPTRAARFMVGCLGCFCPGLTEMVGSLCNLNWVLFYGVALVGLRDPKKKLRGGEILWISLSLFSIGTSVLLVPLFCFRYLLSKQYRRQNGILLGVLFLALLAMFWVKQENAGQFPPVPKMQLLKVLTKTSYENFALRPWFGDQKAIALIHSAKIHRSRAIKIIFMVAILGGLLYRRKNSGFLCLNLFAASVLTWPALSWIARPGNLWSFEIPLNLWFINHRYSFPVALLACYYWVSFLNPEFKFKKTILKDGLAVFFIVINIISAVPRFTIDAYGPEHRWEALATRIESMWLTGSPESVEGPTYPDGWKTGMGAPKIKTLQP